MIALLDTSQDLGECEAELDFPVGQLLTPLTRFSLRDPLRPWAIDNGGFSGLDIAAFSGLLTREAQRKQDCLFVVVPDIVGSARRTLEVFWHWRPKLPGWKLALAAQDGQEDMPIPWEQIEAIFIGGSTKFKCSQGAGAIVKAAKAIGKWVHVGRVNHADRFEHFLALGADSFDGSGVARYTHMRRAIAEREAQGVLAYG